jgi:intein/homing endonuclease
MLTIGKNPIKFQLKQAFKDELKSRSVTWGYGGLSAFTYYRTYSRKKPNGKMESWADTVIRVIEGMFSILKTHSITSEHTWNEKRAHSLAEEAAERLFTFKWTPPGRGLWMMGTDFVWQKGGAALNNPLSPDTEVLTKEYGWIALGDIPTTEVTVLSKLRNSSGQFTGGTGWFSATITPREKHTVYKIAYETKFGNNYEVISSENHRWFRKSTTKKAFERVDTTDLRVGDYLPRSKPALTLDLSLVGAAHGYFFGDGTRSNGELHQFTEENKKVLQKLFASDYFRESDRVLDSGLTDMVVKNLPLAWAKIPEGEYKKDHRYVYGFLAGYFAADGRISDYTIHSSRKQELEEVSQLFWELGIETGQVVLDSESSNFSDTRKLYKLKINRYDLPEKFFIREDHVEKAKTRKAPKYDYHKISSITKLNEPQEVMCLNTPAHENFTIQGFTTTSNCGFVSTENIDAEMSKPFAFLMDMSMVGVGVGFDTKGAGKIASYIPEGDPEVITVEDSREGWVELISCLIDSYLEEGSNPVLPDTSLVRDYGEPIRGFGGVASGPEPLVQGFNGIKDILESRAKASNPLLTSVDITDIMNVIGKIVVAGNVRRTAEIAFAEPDDLDFANMKNWQKFPVETGGAAPLELKEINEEDYNSYNRFENTAIIARKYSEYPWAYKFGGWRWASNNSILAKVGMDYTEVAESIAVNGEPGLAWLDNMQAFSRMKDPADHKDYRVRGGNPCVTSDTWIQTSKGFEQVKDLIGTPFKAVVDGKIYNSSNKGFWFTGSKPVYELEMQNGMTIEATSNHKFLKKSGQWVELNDLEEGDTLVLQNNKVNEYTWTSNLGTKEEGYFIGQLIGDGTFVQDNPILTLFIESKYKNSLNSYTPYNILQNWLATLPARSDAKGLNIARENANTIEVRAKLAILKHISDKFGVFANEKKIPMTGSKEFTIGMLRGFFDADGSVQGTQNKGCSIRLTQVDLERLKNVQILLNGLGIASTIYKNREKEGYKKLPDGKGGTKEYLCKARHELVIANESIVKFSNIINFYDNTKKEKLANLISSYKRTPNKDNFYSKIKNINLKGYKDVYDCTVETVHRFSANGIIAHNCLEQSLEPYELCCLVESFPSNHEDYWDFQRTLKFAYLYAKTVTLVPTHWRETNDVIKRNRRIGTSQSGIQEAIQRFGRKRYLDEFCDRAYNYVDYLDQKYSEWLGVPLSIKRTSIKPSGTVSLVAGALPGIHYAEAESYYRLVRVANTSELIPILEKAGYRVEPAITDPLKTSVIYFPILHEPGTISKTNISIWEQFANAVDLQEYWADNQVSITITFSEHEKSQIARALSCFDRKLKGVSLLPISDHGYAQAPYTPAPREEIEQYMATLSPLDFSALTAEGENAEANKFCDSSGCEI